MTRVRHILLTLAVLVAWLAALVLFVWLAEVSDGRALLFLMFLMIMGAVGIWSWSIAGAILDSLAARPTTEGPDSQ